MGIKKIRPVIGRIKKDKIVIGIGWSSQDSSFLITILNVYIGLKVVSKFNRKPIKTIGYAERKKS